MEFPGMAECRHAVGVAFEKSPEALPAAKARLPKPGCRSQRSGEPEGAGGGGRISAKRRGETVAGEPGGRCGVCVRWFRYAEPGPRRMAGDEA